MDPFKPNEHQPFDSRETEVIHPELSKESIDAYTKNPYYSDKWMPLLSGEKKYAGLNLYAFLFGESWCVYRKQYSLAAVVFVISIIINIAGSYLYLNFVDSSYKGQRLSFFVGILSMLLLVRLPLSIFANQLYFKKTRMNIESFINLKLPAEYFTAQIKDTGGINMGGFFICQALFAISVKLSEFIG
jgi:hypothetical protein